MANLILKLRERAESYRQSSPSAQHTAVLLDEAAEYMTTTNREWNDLRERYQRALDVLHRLAANKAAFDRSDRNQADAYYCLVKGCDADWSALEAVLSPSPKSESSQ